MVRRKDIFLCQYPMDAQNNRYGIPANSAAQNNIPKGLGANRANGAGSKIGRAMANLKYVVCFMLLLPNVWLKGGL